MPCAGGPDEVQAQAPTTSLRSPPFSAANLPQQQSPPPLPPQAQSPPPLARVPSIPPSPRPPSPTSSFLAYTNPPASPAALTPPPPSSQVPLPASPAPPVGPSAGLHWLQPAVQRCSVVLQCKSIPGIWQSIKATSAAKQHRLCRHLWVAAGHSSALWQQHKCMLAQPQVKHPIMHHLTKSMCADVQVPSPICSDTQPDSGYSCAQQVRNGPRNLLSALLSYAVSLRQTVLLMLSC